MHVAFHNPEFYTPTMSSSMPISVFDAQKEASESAAPACLETFVKPVQAKSEPLPNLKY